MKKITATILARTLGKILLAQQETIATAESCTGGLIAGAITHVPGSSAWFNMGLITYSNQAKIKLLSIDSYALQQHGAVSKYTVKKMAQHIRQLANADWSIAVSGIAGPSCPNNILADNLKTIGSIWFGVAGPKNFISTFHRQFQGSRYQIRQQAVRVGLTAIIDALHQTSCKDR